MSGHSKWKNIKEKKGKMDSQKGKVFTKAAREILLAVKDGGPDPTNNFKLKMAVANAKACNMPSDNIKRTIEKAVGQGGDSLEEITYEGYGPHGVAIIVEVITDNKNRTAADIRNTFAKYNGSLGETGCVGWMFDKKGIISLDSGQIKEEDLLDIIIEKGADDLKEENEKFEIITDVDNFQDVKNELEERKLNLETAEITLLPKNTVNIDDKEKALLIIKLIDMLEENEDVKDVYANFDIASEIMEELV